MKRDERLVRLFLEKYGRDSGQSYEIKELPDNVIRNLPAVEAIAKDRYGNSLAIEHTLVQPFMDERDDAQSFLAVFAPLETDASLSVPEYDITLWVSVGAVPKGLGWNDVGTKVGEGF